VFEARVMRHFQERMPYGLFVPEVPSKYLISYPQTGQPRRGGFFFAQAGRHDCAIVSL
jgi:hypothetical protein